MLIPLLFGYLKRHYFVQPETHKGLTPYGFLVQISHLYWTKILFAI